MKEFGFALLGLVGFALLAWFILVTERPMAKFKEETRRQVYEESVTARTSCQKELLRLYGEAQKEGHSLQRKRALELQALNEYNRARCDGLSNEIQEWMENIK